MTNVFTRTATLVPLTVGLLLALFAVSASADTHITDPQCTMAGKPGAGFKCIQTSTWDGLRTVDAYNCGEGRYFSEAEVDAGDKVYFVANVMGDGSLVIDAWRDDAGQGGTYKITYTCVPFADGA